MNRAELPGIMLGFVIIACFLLPYAIAAVMVWQLTLSLFTIVLVLSLSLLKFIGFEEAGLV